VERAGKSKTNKHGNEKDEKKKGVGIRDQGVRKGDEDWGGFSQAGRDNSLTTGDKGAETFETAYGVTSSKKPKKVSAQNEEMA